MDLENRADEPLPFSDELDENGLPIPSLSHSSDDDREKESHGFSETSDFAADFYNSGSDWSSLIAPADKNKNKGPLVQRNLLQMWGINKSKEEELKSGSSDSSVNRKRGRREIGRAKNEDSADRSSVSRLKRERAKVDQPRACPFYKKIPGTPFTVDAFRYGAIEGCSAYFLTHFHYDHYAGLSKKWSHGNIYCTALTAQLVKTCLTVNSLYVHPLEFDREYEIEGVKIGLIEANHCPGSALIHFRLSDGRTYLHTGDFRACKLMKSHPILISHRVNLLYLDTTYCNPKYRFPSKEEVVDFVVRTTRKYLEREPETLIVVGAYSIGKERVYLAISQALKVPIYTDASRRRILELFNWSELSGRISSCSYSSSLHVLPLSFVRHERLKNYLGTLNQRFKAVLAFQPTGWTYSESAGSQLDLIKPNAKGNVTIYGVPYSEHSSFTELRDFVKFLRPEKIIPTVNVGNAASRDKMQAYFRDWLKA